MVALKQIRSTIKNIVEQIRSTIRERLDEPCPEPYDYVKCPDCNRRMYFRDVFEHYFVKHLEIRERLTENRENDNSKSSTTHEHKVRKRDLLDSYELDRPSDQEDDGNELPKPDKKYSELKEKRLRSKWNNVIEKLEERGEVKVSKNQHKGGLRGNHIVRRFEQVAKRLDIEVETEYGDSCSRIKKV